MNTNACFGKEENVNLYSLDFSNNWQCAVYHFVTNSYADKCLNVVKILIK